MRLVMPRLYVILDAGLMKASAEVTAQQLIDSGVQLLQYRSKSGSAREVLQISRTLAAISSAGKATLFVNDRPDIAYLSGADGVHVGQTDLGVDETRTVVGAGKWIGVSTHNEAQFRAAIATSADYVAVGPVFATKSKENPDPVVGAEFIRRMRGLTTKPIVAIGGITVERAAEVIEAGANSVAVNSDILRADNPVARAREFLQAVQAAKPGANHG
jgi:thiamine-phosphate pyrophosphorylase